MSKKDNLGNPIAENKPSEKQRESKPAQPSAQPKSSNKEKSDRAVTTKDWGRNDSTKHKNYNDYNQ